MKTFYLFVALFFFSSSMLFAEAIKLTDADNVEAAFYYSENFDNPEATLKPLKDSNCASSPLFANQLGSVYLAKGDYDDAFNVLLDASYSMGEGAISKNLEKKALSMFGSENEKLYKGDPYEKMMNSLYLGTLFYKKGDYDNAFACFKNGILCDSDTTKELYKSDFALLYLMAGRVSALRKEPDNVRIYFDQATNAYKLSNPINRDLVSEQALLQDKLMDKKTKPADLAQMEVTIAELGKSIERNSSSLDFSFLKQITDLNNNILLFVELGKGPIKYRTGDYGYLAKFTERPREVATIKVKINGKEINPRDYLTNNDIFFQAATRGGRRMDAIHKGQAVFKSASDTVGNVLIGFGAIQSAVAKDRSQRDLGAIVALVGLGAKAISYAANPAADIRHWSLLPAEIVVVPMKLSKGEYSLEIECYDINGQLVESKTINSKMVIDKEQDIVFRRIK